MISAHATDMDLVMAEMESAEEFLDFFSVDYDQETLENQRLPLLKAFNQNLASHENPDWDDYRDALERAYCMVRRGERIAVAESRCGGCSGCDH